MGRKQQLGFSFGIYNLIDGNSRMNIACWLLSQIGIMPTYSKLELQKSSIMKY